MRCVAVCDGHFGVLLGTLDTCVLTVEFMRANIVGTVIVFSAIIWIPVSCLVSRAVSCGGNISHREAHESLLVDASVIVLPVA